MLSKTRWVFVVVVLVSALSLSSRAFLARPVSNRAATNPPGSTGKCDPTKSKDIHELLPCAWDEAKRQMSKKFSCSDRLVGLERGEIHFRRGEWYDAKLRQYVVGDTDLHDDPPIQVGLTGDSVFDYETIVHEFKHYIVDSLRLGESAHRWIDSGNDEIPGLSIHSKKSR
jgi:hypothetical protein